jgi:hypothetical protein
LVLIPQSFAALSLAPVKRIQLPNLVRFSRIQRIPAMIMIHKNWGKIESPDATHKPKPSLENGIPSGVLSKSQLKPRKENSTANVTIMEGALNFVTIKPLANPITQHMIIVKMKATMGTGMIFHKVKIHIGAKVKNPSADRSNSLQARRTVSPRDIRMTSGADLSNIDRISKPAWGNNTLYITNNTTNAKKI